MNYKVINNHSLHRLEEVVNNHLQEGWILQGGVAVSNSPTVPVFCQAMIKYDNEAKVIDLFPKVVHGQQRGNVPNVPSSLMN